MGKRVALLVMLGCNGTAAPIATPPSHPVAPVTAPAAAKPISGRWVLTEPAGLPMGRALDLGKRKIVPFAYGERWMIEGAKKTNAPSMLGDDLVAALKASDGVDFVGASGTVYRTRDPLDVPFETRVPPTKLVHAAASDLAIVGATSDGKLFRSTDRGKSWTETSIFALGAVRDVVLARDGRGTALLVPAGTAVTTDHGATWKRTPDITAESVTIGDDGNVVVGPKKVATPVADDTKMAAVAITGSTALYVTQQIEKKVYRYAVAELGKPRDFKPLPFESCVTMRAAAFDKSLSIGCVRHDSGNIFVEELHSDDRGVTWTKQPQRPILDDETSYVIGPNGFFLHDRDWGKTSFRTSTTAPVQELAERLLFASIDPSGKKFVALRSVEGGWEVVVSPLDHYDPTPRGRVSWSSTSSRGLGVLTLDEDDNVFGFLPGYSTTTMLRISAKGKVETRELALVSPRFAAKGRRAVLAHGRNLYETIDAGEHFHRIGHADGAPFACSDRGCAFASAARLDWDPSSDDGAIVAPAKEQPEPTPTKPTPISCTNGKALFKGVIEAGDVLRDVDVGPELRFFADGALLRGDTNALQTVTLSAKQRPKMQTVFLDVPGGIVVLRYTIAPKTPGTFGTRPVSVEVLWMRDHEKVPHAFSFGNLGLFRIMDGDVGAADRFYPWIAGFVDGGLAIQPTHPRGRRRFAKPSAITSFDPGSEPIYFLRDNGTLEKKIKAPALSNVMRIVTRAKDGTLSLIPRAADSSGQVKVASSTDGATWNEKTLRVWFPDPPRVASDDDLFDAVGSMWDRHNEALSTTELIEISPPTWSVAANGASYAYTITLEGDVKSYAIASKPCAAGSKGIRIPLRLARATHSAVDHDLDEMLLRGLSDGTACVRAMGSAERAIVGFEDPTHSVNLINPLTAMSCVLPK